MLANDPNLFEDLKKLKRQTKHVNISAQNSLAKITLLGTTEGNEEDIHSDNVSQKLVESMVERNAKSIGNTITNS